MIVFNLIFFLINGLLASHLETNQPFSHTSKQKIFPINPGNEYNCTSSTQINGKNFTDLVIIKSDIGCQSISIINCIFVNIRIPENCQSDGQISLIYVKNADISIEDSNFQECYSNIKIKSSFTSNLGIDSNICHIIYIDENINHKVIINNCVFSDNGFVDISDGTLILVNNANIVEITSSQFISKNRSTRALQSIYTKNIILASNTFYKMIGAVGQNGGALFIQFSINVSISDCIFDNNTLQMNSINQNVEIRGSAFYINLNESFIFTSNIIMNHDTYLNSVITFNNFEISEQNFLENDQNFYSNKERKFTILNSNFTNNKYSKLIDGSGIGFYAEDLNEKLSIRNSNDDSYFLNIVFYGCLFDQNGNEASIKSDKASILGWSRKTSILSFINCKFESNNFLQASSLLIIQNGHSLLIESCTIKGNTNFCFLKFSPLTIEKRNWLVNEVQITNTTFISSDLLNRNENDFILIENNTELNTSLVINGCTFTNISLDSSNSIIRCKSNLYMISILNTIITSNDKSRRSNVITMQNSDVEFMTITDCIFETCLYSILSDVTIKKTVISDCHFIDCVSDTSNLATIKVDSNEFICENCDIIFTTHLDGECSMGIFVYGVKSAIIMNVDFRNCLGLQPGSAIRCLSQNSNETSLTVASCSFTDCAPNNPNIYTTNREVNFISNTITCSCIEKHINGIYINYMSRILIDNCSFTRCSCSNGGGSIKYNPSSFDPDVIESIIVQNCQFFECSGRAAVAGINAYYSRPKFINIIILNCSHNFNFIMEMIPIDEVNETGEVLLQNVSFVNTHPDGNVAAGGGGCGFWFKTMNSDEDTVSFIDCHFENVYYHALDTTSYGGGAICIQSQSCMNFYIKIVGCLFYNCYTFGNNGGAIAISTKKRVSIENCYLENCRIENNDSDCDFKGGAIFINQNQESYPFHLINITVNNSISNTDFTAVDFECKNCAEFIIRDCNFINCKTRGYKKLSYNIISCPISIQKFDCLNSNFIFDEKSELNARAFMIYPSTFSIDNCQFIRCGSKLIDEGGVILYDGKSSEETILIDNCVFKECEAVNSGAFRLKLNTISIPLLSNNTIIKINSKYIIAIEYKSEDLKEIILFRKNKFIRNTNGLDGGGSGVWVQNYHDEQTIYSIHLEFQECEFVDNYSPANGGAFGVGSSESVKPTELTFESCNFTGNHCNGADGGGALWIRTSGSCTISDCLFEKNFASESIPSNGGAIYLSFTSETLKMEITRSTFINNSSPYSLSKGHAIYSTLLYGSIILTNCNFTDNGYGIENENSIIYTRSEFEISDSRIEFTDKEKAFSRAIYVGASSDLSIIDCFIANFSIHQKGGAALYYESIRNRNSLHIVLYGNTFVNNTSDKNGSEIYFHVNSISPRIYNCSFFNEDCKFELIMINFHDMISFSTRYDRFYFFNCNFNYNQIFSVSHDAQEEKINEENFDLVGCRYISCRSIPLLFNNANSVELTKCIFDGNINENCLIRIEGMKTALIKGCQFKNNTLVTNATKSYKGKIELIVIDVQNVPLTIHNTLIENQKLLDENNEILNCFVIKINSNLEMIDVSIINCTSCNESIYFTPPIESIYDEFERVFIPSIFSMDNCIVKNSGVVLINDWTEQVSVCNSVFSDSNNGLIYKPTKSISSRFISDIIHFEGNVFDGFSDLACAITVLNDINIKNLTIKNCQSVGENCPPIFELDILNNTINEFLFDHFTFENNKFNNSNNQRWMNGGGIGFILDLAYVNAKGKNGKEIFLNFNDCNFISNNAEFNGGAFAYRELNETTTFLNFLDCYFNGNVCNQDQGNSLYLEVKNVSIENCIFEFNSRQNKSSELLEREHHSTIYLHFIPSSSNLISNTFLIHNCSFDSNQDHSMYIQNSSKDIIIMNCSFLNNQNYSLFIENCAKSICISESCFSNNQEYSLYITNCYSNISLFNCSFTSNQDHSMYICNCNEIIIITNCSFTSNQQYSLHINDCKPNIFISYCSFQNNCEYSLHISNQVNFLSIYKSSFSNNNDNAIYAARIVNGVAILDCLFSEYQRNTVYIDECQDDIFISNCSFETNKINVLGNDFFQSCSIYAFTNASFTMTNIFYKEEKEEEQKNVLDYSVACYCTKSFLIENCSIYFGGIYIFPNSSITDQVELIDVSIQNSNYGFHFQQDEEIQVQCPLSIIECSFSSVKHALLLTLMNDKFILKRNLICDCFNLDDNPNKLSIISIKINTSINLIFDGFEFARNKYLQPKEQTTGFGGGIGINILTSNIDQAFSLEFSKCTFISNEATDGKSIERTNCFAGGSFYYVSNNDLILMSLSFQNCLFIENSALGKGGAVYIETNSRTPLLIRNCTFRMNRAEVNGAAIFVKNENVFTLDSSEFINNTVSQTSSSSSLIPTDSLSLFTNANVLIEKTQFIKSVFRNQQSNVQAMFSVSNGNALTIDVFDCVFSIINPSKSVLVLNVPNTNSKIVIYNTSFTHFYLQNGTIRHSPFPSPADESNFDRPSKDKLKLNSDVRYVPIYIEGNLNGKLNVNNSCFDTYSIYSFNGEQIGLENGNEECSSDNVLVNQNQVKSLKCVYPPLIDDLIEQVFDSTPIPPYDPDENDKNKLLLIGLIVGAGVLVIIIISVIVTFVLIRKKKKKEKEKEEKMKKDAEKEKEMNKEEEEEEVNKIDFASQAMTQENPLFTYAGRNQIDSIDYEESIYKDQNEVNKTSI